MILFLDFASFLGYFHLLFINDSMPKNCVLFLKKFYNRQFLCMCLPPSILPQILFKRLLSYKKGIHGILYSPQCDYFCYNERWWLDIIRHLRSRGVPNHFWHLRIKLVGRISPFECRKIPWNTKKANIDKRTSKTFYTNTEAVKIFGYCYRMTVRKIVAKVAESHSNTKKDGMQSLLLFSHVLCLNRKYVAGLRQFCI